MTETNLADLRITGTIICFELLGKKWKNNLVWNIYQSHQKNYLAQSHYG